MRSTKVSIAARASAVLEESEGSGVPMDEETSPQDVSDGDMKTPAKKKGEGGKPTTAKKTKKDGIADKVDGDKNRKAASSPMKEVASTKKHPCATKGKAKAKKVCYEESEEDEEEEESEYEEDDDHNQAKGSGVESVDGGKAASSPAVSSTKKPPCAKKGIAKAKTVCFFVVFISMKSYARTTL